MGFAQDVQELRPKVEAILEATQHIDDEFIEAVKSIGSIDTRMLQDAIDAIKVLDTFSGSIEAVKTGIPDIRATLEIQNQIRNVSDIRDSVGIVAGNIDKVKKVADCIDAARPILAMKPMIEDVLSLSIAMDKVMDMEYDIDRFLKTADRMEDVLKQINDSRIEIKKSEELCANMLNEIRIAEKRIDEKRQEMVDLRNTVRDFSVDVKYLSPDSTPSHHYSPANNTLTLGIPEGKQGIPGPIGPPGKRGRDGNAVAKGDKGDQGNEGRAGKDFVINFSGNLHERKRYDSYPKSVSFLALDQDPPMLFFKKSDNVGDWTNGKEFGSIVMDVALNSERLNGYTMEDIIGFISEKMKNEIDKVKREIHG